MHQNIGAAAAVSANGRAQMGGNAALRALQKAA